MEFTMNVKGREFDIEVTESNKVIATELITSTVVILTENGAYANKSGFRNAINRKFDFAELENLEEEMRHEDELITIAEYAAEMEAEHETEIETENCGDGTSYADVMHDLIAGAEEKAHEHDEATDMEDTIDPVIARCLPKYVNSILTVGVKTDEGYRLVIESGEVVTAGKWNDARKQICDLCKSIHKGE